MAVTRIKGVWGNANSLSNPPVAIDPGILQMDGAISIGQIPIPLNDAILLASATLTDNNSGQANAPDISINVGAGATGNIVFACSEYIKQVTAFLSTTSNPPLNNSGVYADDSGDTPIAKGIKIVSFELCYSVQGGPMTSLNFRADITNHSSQAAVIANANTNLYPNTAQVAGALASTAGATTCRNLIIPIATPVFDVVDATNVYAKLTAVNPGGCTFRLYAAMMNVAFNYL